MTPEFKYISGIEYQTVQPFDWVIGGKFAPMKVTIPAGFVFQSSVPRWLWWWLSPHHPRFLLAACVHDWLLGIGYDRAAAAGEWFAGARAAKAPMWKAKPAFVGVAYWAVYKNGAYE